MRGIRGPFVGDGVIIRKLTTLLAAIVLVGAFAPGPVLAEDDPDMISIAAGAYDWNRKKDQGAEFRGEYRWGYKIPYIQWKPFVAVAGTSTGQGFIGAGVLWDIYLGRRVVVTPSFAPHLYAGGNDDLDLDYPLEFRSQLEIAYRFDNRSRLGLSISHYSNASLGDTNPGTESAMLYYSIPAPVVWGWFGE